MTGTWQAPRGGVGKRGERGSRSAAATLTCGSTTRNDPTACFSTQPRPQWPSTFSLVQLLARVFALSAPLLSPGPQATTTTMFVTIEQSRIRYSKYCIRSTFLSHGPVTRRPPLAPRWLLSLPLALPSPSSRPFTSCACLNFHPSKI